jgi:uncharacterized protein (TIGR02466 family)
MKLPVPPGFSSAPLFATPFISGVLPDAEAINPTLESAILRRRGEDAGVTRSNDGGWHSRHDVLEWGGEALAVVARAIVGLADAHTHDSAAVPSVRRGWRLEGWANVIEGAGGHHRHVHPGCFWSAVYYVKVDPGEGGELELFDPRGPQVEMYAPDLRIEGQGNGIHRIAPVAGQLVLFPSWLSHAVVPYRGDGRRITVAINLMAGPRPTGGAR